MPTQHLMEEEEASCDEIDDEDELRTERSKIPFSHKLGNTCDNRLRVSSIRSYVGQDV